MKFTEKYCSDSEKTKLENKAKKAIADDAYALGEVLQDLGNKIEKLRVSLLNG